MDENKAQVARLVVTVTDYLEYRQVSSEEKNQYYTTSVNSEHRAQSTLHYYLVESSEPACKGTEVTHAPSELLPQCCV